MILPGDRVKMVNGVAGRLSHRYDNPSSRGPAHRAAITVLREANPPHPRHGSHWTEQWTSTYTELRSLEIVKL